MITNNEPLTDYFKGLESIVGQEVEMPEVLPKFAKHYSGMYRIPNTIYNIGLYLKLEESDKSNDNRSFSIILNANSHLVSGSEWSLIQLLKIGHVEYDGLIK